MKKLLYTFLSISIIFSACEKEEVEVITSTIVNGCTDVSANNYNTLATIDDGSCAYTIFGCTDSVAINYNSNATNDDNSCIYSIVGIWSPTFADVIYSASMGGMILFDTSYTTSSSDPEWEFTDVEFTADGQMIMDGESIPYSHSGNVLTITEDGETETAICTVTSTDMVVIMNDTEEEDGVTMTSNITINHTRQ